MQELAIHMLLDIYIKFIVREIDKIEKKINPIFNMC